jgi:hypothetical protein
LALEQVGHHRRGPPEAPDLVAEGWPVSIPTRVVIELILFGAAAGALAVAGLPLAAVVLGVAALVTSLLNASHPGQASGAGELDGSPPKGTSWLSPSGPSLRGRMRGHPPARPQPESDAGWSRQLTPDLVAR